MTFANCAVLLISMAVGLDAASQHVFCDPDEYYCGSELKSLGYTNVESDALYVCGKDFNGFFHMHCEHGCVPNDKAGIHGSYCTCLPGAKYCGYELWWRNTQHEDWTEDHLEDHGLYQCDEHHHVLKVDSCANGCQDTYTLQKTDAQCAKSPPPRCASGQVYCGYELGPTHRHIDWHPQRLYRCAADGSGVPVKPRPDCADGCHAHDNENSFCNLSSLKAVKPK